MNSKYFLYYIFLCVTIISCNSPKASNKQDNNKSNSSVKERLNHPFGTLLKLTVEIVDGDLLASKGLEGSFLFKIKSVDSIALSNTILMEFKDETGKFPNEVFGLHKYLYGNDVGQIPSDEYKKMKKKYVGHEFNIVAYETGEFTGVPDGYFKYQRVRQDVGFGFMNYLIVVAGLTKSK